MNTGTRFVRLGMCLAVWVLASASLLAQDFPSSGQAAKPALGPSMHSSLPPAPDALGPLSFGLQSANLSIPADAFMTLDSGMAWNFDGASTGRIRSGASSSHWFNAPINLPSGAHIYFVAFEVYDNDPASDINTWIGVNNGAPAGTPSTYTTIANSSALSGWDYIYNAVDVTIDNFNNSYFLQVSMSDNGGLHVLRRASVYYTLQVHPAPVTASFGDVPTGHPFFQYIEALYASGITGGCQASPPLYCPDNPLTRGQMAVFLSKALGLYWPN